MDNGHISCTNNWIVPATLTASAFISLLSRLLSIDRPDITEELFQSYSADDLDIIFDGLFLDNRNFRNVRRQIHENLELTELGMQVPIELYLQPVLCIGTGTCVPQINSQPRGTLIADCDFSIDCNTRVSPHLVCDAWQVDNLPFNAFGCVFFAHAGDDPPVEDVVELIKALSVYYCTLLPGGIFIYNSGVWESAEAPEILARRNGFSTFEKWKQQWINAFSKVGFLDIEILIKQEHAFRPDAVSILTVARKEY